MEIKVFDQENIFEPGTGTGTDMGTGTSLTLVPVPMSVPVSFHKTIHV